MESIFKEIYDMYEVHGLVLLTTEGKILYEAFKDNRISSVGRNSFDWITIAESLGDFQEADLVFEGGRFYVRKVDAGYLMISMNGEVSMPMIKLSCDIMIPKLSKVKPKKGFGRFFGL